MRMLAIAAVALFAIGAVLWWKTREQAPVEAGVASSKVEQPPAAVPPSAVPPSAVPPADDSETFEQVPPPPAPKLDPASAPASCKQYAEKMERCLVSDKFPADVREMSKQSFEAMRSGWTGLAGASAEEQQQAFSSNDQACKTQLEAMKNAGAALCPGVF